MSKRKWLLLMVLIMVLWGVIPGGSEISMALGVAYGLCWHRFIYWNTSAQGVV